MLEIQNLHVKFHNRDRAAKFWDWWVNPAPENPSLP